MTASEANAVGSVKITRTNRDHKVGRYTPKPKPWPSKEAHDAAEAKTFRGLTVQGTAASTYRTNGYTVSLKTTRGWKVIAKHLTFEQAATWPVKGEGSIQPAARAVR